MGKLEWGKKRICPSCALKYYDFNKSPITCPSCNMEFDPDLFLKSRKGKNFSPKQDIANTQSSSNIEDVEIESDEEDNVEINKVLEDTEDTEDKQVTDIESDITFDDDDDDDESLEVISEDLDEDKN